MTNTNQNWRKEFKRVIDIYHEQECSQRFWEGCEPIRDCICFVADVEDFIQKVEQQAYERGRRDMLEECVDAVGILTVKSDHYFGNYDWSLKLHDETLAFAAYHGQEEGLMRAYTTLKSKLTNNQ